MANIKVAGSNETGARRKKKVIREAALSCVMKGIVEREIIKARRSWWLSVQIEVLKWHIGGGEVNCNPYWQMYALPKAEVAAFTRRGIIAPARKWFIESGVSSRGRKLLVAIASLARSAVEALENQNRAVWQRVSRRKSLAFKTFWRLRYCTTRSETTIAWPNR